MRELKVKNITLVLGYKEKLIKREIINFKKYFNFNYAYNKNYKKLGNSYSLLIGLKKTKVKAIIFDGDLVYSKILEKIFILWTRNVFLIGKNSISDVECAKALANNNGFVRYKKFSINQFELKK